ncbi:MAG: hypothetical protein ACPL7K_09090, partial [Armatimonadota bacterium]
RKVEGWALDVSETDAEVGRSTLRQRLAENNKLWAASMIGMVLLTIGLLRFADQPPDPREKYQIRPAGSDLGSPNDAAHLEFAQEFVRERPGRLDLLEARFVSPESFRITVPASTSRDDIDFLAKAAGLRIIHKFRIRPVVQVYLKSAGSPATLAATAHWEAKKYGFVVKFYGVQGK